MIEAAEAALEFTDGQTVESVAADRLVSFAVVRAPSGAVAGSVAVARDATPRYEEERARRQRSEAHPAHADTREKP